MSGPSRRLWCHVPGCSTSYVQGGGHERREHSREIHVECGCGWVGVGHVWHVAQRRRRGLAVDACEPVRLLAWFPGSRRGEGGQVAEVVVDVLLPSRPGSPR